MDKQIKDFKVRCVEARSKNSVNNKVYEVRDGVLYLENNQKYNNFRNGLLQSKFENVEQINNQLHSKFELVEETEPTFTKSDLRTGMRVETREHHRYVVLKDIETTFYGHQEILLAKQNEFLTGSDYKEDLLDKNDATFDIIKVWEPNDESNLLDVSLIGKLLYSRAEPTYVTKEEAEAMLSEAEGKEIKIRKE